MLDAGVYVHVSQHAHMCVCVCVCVRCVSHCHRCDRLNLQTFSKEPLSLAAAYVISVPQVSSTFPAPACLLPPGGPYGSADLMSRQLEVVRVINADQRPLRQRGCEWVLKDCEGQL